jgi:uncharacterized protein YjiS (DUF1127 family)
MSHCHDGHPAIWPSGWNALTPAQKGNWTRKFVRRVHRARSRAIGSLLLGWTRYVRRRQLRRDLAELSAMDDMMLRDVGVSRSQVRGAIWSGTDLEPR